MFKSSGWLQIMEFLQIQSMERRLMSPNKAKATTSLTLARTFSKPIHFQVVVGIWSIIYLSTDMLETHFSEEVAQLASLIFIVANFMAGMAGMFIIERYVIEVLSNDPYDR